MTTFEFVGAGGTLHTIELPYAVNRETAREWFATLDYPSPERRAALEAQRKAEQAERSEQLRQEEHERLQWLFAQAEKLTNFDGPVYDPYAGEWFDDVSIFWENHENDDGIGLTDDWDDGDIPPWVFASKPSPFPTPTIDDICQSNDDIAHVWESIEKLHPDAIAELNQALKKFIDTIQHFSGCRIDYSRVVLVRPQEKQS